MIMRASMVMADRMNVAKHSEGLFFDELSVLSSPSNSRHITDVLVHFKNSDQRIYMTLVMTTLLLAIFVSLTLRKTFSSCLLLVFKVSLGQSI